MDEKEDLKKEIIDLKIRLKRVEEYLLAIDFPSIKDYIPTSDSDPFYDSLFEDAVRIIQQYDLASASLLQRKLSIGYSRAAKILDLLESEGYIGEAEGSKPRKVLKKEQTTNKR